MRIYLITTLLIILSGNAYSQNNLSKFGEFTQEEKDLKVCDFDKDADAVILFHFANSDYDNEYNLVTIHNVRFKILKEKGIERANIEIPFYSKDNFENISGLKAIISTPNDDGTEVVKTLDHSASFIQKLNSIFSIVKFTMPNVKVGSIIEYEYTSTLNNFRWYDDWFFQSEMPTMSSNYFITVPPNNEFQYIIHKKSDLNIKVSKANSDGGLSFEMDSIPGLRDEPYMDAPRDYLQRVEFQFSGYNGGFGYNSKFMTTWKEMNNELRNDTYFYQLINKKLSNCDAIIAEASSVSSLEEKMVTIYNYVRTHFQWNDTYTKFAEDGLSDVIKKRTGTSGEINWLLLNLLKKCGLEVYPLLVSDRNHGKVNTDYPILDQFNSVDAYVICNDKTYILDATQANTPAQLIPFGVLNTSAFIVDAKKSGIVKLENNNNIFSNSEVLRATINDDGEIKGNVNILSDGYSKIGRARDYDKSKDKFKKNYLLKDYGGITIDSFKVENIDNDSLPLNQQFNFSMPCNKSGDYKLLSLNLFSDFEKNPFISENRYTDIDFGCRHMSTLVESFEIPSDMKPDELPKNIQLIMPDTSFSFSRRIIYDGNIISARMVFKINKTLFNADDYADIKEYYKKLEGLLNEQIVLIKK